MSLQRRQVKLQSNIINYEEPYAIIQKPTNATFIPEKTMEIDEETKDIRQKSAVVYYESKLAEDKETKGQEKKEGATKIMESKPIGHA